MVVTKQYGEREDEASMLTNRIGFKGQSHITWESTNKSSRTSHHQAQIAIQSCLSSSAWDFTCDLPFSGVNLTLEAGPNTCPWNGSPARLQSSFDLYYSHMLPKAKFCPIAGTRQILVWQHIILKPCNYAAKQMNQKNALLELTSQQDKRQVFIANFRPQTAVHWAGKAHSGGSCWITISEDLTSCFLSWSPHLLPLALSPWQRRPIL